MLNRLATAAIEHWTALATLLTALLTLLGVVVRYMVKGYRAIDAIMAEIKDNTRRTNKLQIKMDYMIEHGTKPMQEIMDKAHRAEQ